MPILMLLKIGVHWNVQITTSLENPQPIVTQVFCSALPVAYNKANPSSWSRIAQLILEASYEATLLTGVILYVFGSGPIKGFATTLIIGIITSLFSAIFITRLIISWRLNKGKSMSFSTKLTDGAFKNLNIDFIGKRKIFYILSSLLILFGGYSLTTKGLNYGIDFVVGRTYVVSFEGEVNKDDVKNGLVSVFNGQAPSVSSFNLKGQAGEQLKITTKYRIDENNLEADNDVKLKLFEGLASILLLLISILYTAVSKSLLITASTILRLIFIIF